MLGSFPRSHTSTRQDLGFDSSPIDLHKIGVEKPGLAGRGALWGPPSQQCPGPRPAGPPSPQQGSGFLQPGWEGAEKELSPGYKVLST